ncbi:hypothetical protein TrVGV298_006340 [Trichoderma virens]|nr:hypothetical protein TrVGV298_006340 [Trichoderma virens]
MQRRICGSSPLDTSSTAKFPPGYVVMDSLGMVSSSSSSPPISSDEPIPASSRSDWPLLHVDLGPDAGLDTMALIEPCQNIFSFLNSLNMAGHAAPTSVQDEDTRLRNPATGSGTQSDFLIHDKASRILTKRRGLTATTVLSTRTILGQVLSYPSMLLSGHTLPPFIHSQCNLDDSLMHDCAKAQKHGCLRRTLSICASLVGMWMDRTPVSSPFVWETIYNEINRIHKEAMAIYLLLQAQDTETLVKNDVKFLLISLGEVAQKLHSTLGYNTFVDTIENPLCRPTWTLYESTRSTNPAAAKASPPRPSPCIRDLWEVPSTYEWGRRYSAFLRGRTVDKILTLADYKLSHQLTAEELVNGSGTGEMGAGITKDIMKWCEGLDQFGTLVSIAATLVKYDRPLTMGSNGYNKIA